MNKVMTVKSIESAGPIILAENGAITTTFETIWGQASAYTFLTAQAVMTISSANANDTSAGTGARTCRVTGVNTAYALVTETATMNGQTGVTLANEYMIINSIEVLTAGSGLVNAGIIYVGTGTVTAGVPAVVHGYMPAGRSVSTHGFRGIPTEQNLVISYVWGATRSTTAGGHELNLRYQSGGVWRDKLILTHANTFYVAHDLPHPIVMPGPGIAEFRVLATAGTGPYALTAYGAMGANLVSC